MLGMTSLKAQRIASDIVEICERLHRRNMLAAADGNISYRISDDEILITPSGISKAFMNSEHRFSVGMDRNESSNPVESVA